MRRTLLLLHASAALLGGITRALHVGAAPRGLAARLGAISLAAPPAPEFSRPFALGAFESKKSARVEVRADSSECAALARRFDFEELSSLAANVSLAVVDRRRMRIRARGTLSAVGLRQRNFVGDSVYVPVSEVPFETYFIATDADVDIAQLELDVADDEARAATRTRRHARRGWAARARAHRAHHLSHSRAISRDLPQAFDEIVCDGRIDLSEVVAQHLYLHVDDANSDAAGEWREAPGEVVIEWGDGDDASSSS